MANRLYFQGQRARKAKQRSRSLADSDSVLGCFAVVCIDLNGVPLRDWDEGTVAQVAREISRGETWTAWLHPQLWGQPYLNKPPLMHGLIAMAYRLWGVQTWTARFPGALLTATSVPLLFLLGRSLFSTRLPALLGASVYLTSLPVVRHGRLAMLDGPVACFFIATLLMLMQVLASPTSSKRRSLWYYGVGVGLALMGLTKAYWHCCCSRSRSSFLPGLTPNSCDRPTSGLASPLGGYPLAAGTCCSGSTTAQPFGTQPS